MEDINQKVVDKVSNYFNNVLKNFLKYPETFQVTFNINDRTILLVSNYPSELIKKLNVDPGFVTKIEQNLLSGFKSFDPSVIKVIVNTEGNNKIIIKYDTQKMVVDLDIAEYANISEYLNREEISNICLTSPQFSRLCQNVEFIKELIIRKYPNMSKIYLQAFKDTSIVDVLKKIDLFENIKNALPREAFEKLKEKRGDSDEQTRFSTYDIFLNYQIYYINKLTKNDLNHHLELSEMIKEGSIDTMDKEDMNVNPVDGLYFEPENNKVKTVIFSLDEV